MTKNLIKYIAVLTIIFSFISCEEESNFKESVISLTSVYTLTEVSGPNAFFKINIYKQENIITEYATEDKLKSYTSSGFIDSSTETNYQVTVNKLDNDITYNYVLSADKLTGIGTLTINGDMEYDVKVSENQIYN